MEFKEKYTNESEKLAPENKDKIVLSNNAYSIGEAVDNLIGALLRIHFTLPMTRESLKVLPENKERDKGHGEQPGHRPLPTREYAGDGNSA